MPSCRLGSERERIIVAVHNKGTTKQQLSGSVEVKDVVDLKGQAVNLIFQTVRHNGNGYKEVTTTAVEAGKIKAVTFELLALPITLTPGSTRQPGSCGCDHTQQRESYVVRPRNTHHAERYSEPKGTASEPNLSSGGAG